MSPADGVALTAQFHAHSINAAAAFAETLVENDVLLPRGIGEDGKGPAVMLDVAGGSGCFSAHLARRCENLRCVVMELPVVVPEARLHVKRVLEEGGELAVEDKVRCAIGDMWAPSSEWPRWKGKVKEEEGDYDAVLFSNVFHDWSLEMCETLLKSVSGVLRPGGRVYIHEILLVEEAGESEQQTGRTSRRYDDVVGALLSLHMLVHTSEGAQREGEVWVRALRRAGFGDVRVVKCLKGPFSVVTAVRRN